MPLRPEIAELYSRHAKVHSGLDIGFADGGLSSSLRETCGGTWMTVETTADDVRRVRTVLPADSVLRMGAAAELPFEDAQFEVVVLNGRLISAELVREIHRVLKPAGDLFFTVLEDSTGKNGYSAPLLYRLFLRNGFDVTALRRSPWWHFGRRGRTLTVCARRKAWRK